MNIRNIFIIAIIVAGSVISGCKTGLLGGEQVQPLNQPQTPAAPIVVDGMRTSYADVVEKTSPAVVRIEADHKEKAPARGQLPGGDDFFKQFQLPQPNQRRQIEHGLGSGVVVEAGGTILTNYHVVEGADKITVAMSDNKTYEAKVVGTDQPSDLAVIKIEATNLPFLTLGNSDTVRVGDIVLAIGNPLGIGQTVTAGIISAKGRRTGLSDGSFEDFLQTDAPINRGNSGGALVNLNGELIGINSQILSPGGASGGNIGIAFSIPSNMAKSVMEQLLKDGKVRRGMLGINIQNITDDTAKALELKEKSGILVSNVKSGSAADKAGVKRGDIITAINGEKVEDSNVLRNKVAGTLPGTDIKITVVRDSKELDLTATLDEFKVSDGKNPETGKDGDENGAGPQNQSGKLGLSLEPVTPQTAKQLGLDSDEGLVVIDVDQNGPASEAGISRGDVILEINRKAVNSVAEVKSAIDAAGERPILLLMTRRGQTIYLTVKP
ncbi:MAG: DegQ family serine endoprotease [Pyrinomonadaceae bacterium]